MTYIGGQTELEIDGGQKRNHKLPACNEPSPKKTGKHRLRCNRTVGHDGPHRRLDAYSFAILAEWDDYRYTIEPRRT